MDHGKGFWFLDSYASIPMSSEAGADGISVIRFRMARDHAPPFHVHHTEDEVFHVLAGVIRFQVGRERLTASAGQTLLGPKAVAYGFRVESESAEMLVISKGAFERLVRGLARPAEHDGPPAYQAPSPEMQAVLAARCAEQGIELVGPPID